MEGEVHLQYENGDYFIMKPTDYSTSSDETNIFGYLRSLGIKPAYEVYSDHRNRYLDVIMDKDLSFLEGLDFEDVEVRKTETGTYLLHGPSLTILSHDPKWLAIVDEAWKQGQR
jgi:hypothetical protein